MYDNDKNNGGFSLVEIIIASSLLALMVTSFVGVFRYSNIASQFSGSKNRAVLLAEEGLEDKRNLRDEDFANLIDGSQISTIDDFTRTVVVSTVDADTKEVTSTVNWTEKGFDREVSLLTRLTHWQEEIVVINSCVSYCQSLNYSDGICRQNSTRCSRSGETYESDGDQYCLEGPQADTCCCAL